MRRIRRLIIHHSASPRGVSVEDIRAWHKARGFTDIGYHYVIEEDGKVEIGRPLHVMGAHAKGHNSDSIGVCVVGDNTRPGHGWNHAQMRQLVELVTAARTLWPRIEVLGHRDVAATECPGADVSWVLTES